MKLTVKKMEAWDIGHMKKMATDFAKEMKWSYPACDEEELDKMMMHLLAHINDPSCIYYIAYDGKKPAGFILGYIGEHPWGKPSRIAMCQELYVVPNKRNGLVGFRLIKKAVEFAMTQGIGGMECVGSYGGTIKRWERYGFKPYLVYGHISTTNMLKLIGEKHENLPKDIN